MELSSVVEIDLSDATETLFAMLHTDAGMVGTYEFPGDDVPVQQDGTIVMAPFGIQVAEGEAEIAMVNRSFDPPVLLVRAGTTVTWTNHDGIRHNTESDHGIWKSALFGKDGSYSITFDNPGIYPYFCEPHGGPGGQGMAGAIIVVPA